MGKEMTPEAEKAIAAQKAQAIESAEAAVKKAKEHLKAAEKGLKMALRENG